MWGSNRLTGVGESNEIEIVVSCSYKFAYNRKILINKNFLIINMKMRQFY
jgi:hypothetical protein